MTNKSETPVYQSKEFLEKKALLELEKEIAELRHQHKMEELKLQREFSHKESEERLGEIRLKNANIQRSLIEKDKILRNFQEKKFHTQ